MLRDRIKRIVLWALALLAALSPAAACAEATYQDMADSILAFAMDGSSLQAWIDGPVSEAAGSAMDNYAVNLNRFGSEADFGGYVSAAAAQLAPGALANPVSRQRCALALIACGATEMIPEGLADETIGKLGVMSYIYGLHLVNNGVPSSLWTADLLVDKLLSLQLADGGWAVIGQYGDTDVTAMCLQALACSRGNNPEVARAIAAGVALLSEKQLDGGGFSSTGRENAESCAQVIIALSSLGIDASTDARFNKNGMSAFGALLAYRRPDGGFAHLPGDDASNETASVQALQALSAFTHPGEHYFDFSSVAGRDYAAQKQLPWKFWALIAIGALCAAGCVFALTRRRGRAKQLLFVLLAAAVASAAVCFLDIESAEGYYGAALPSGSEVAGHAFIAIRCDTVAGRAEDGSTPENGVVLSRTEIPFREGDSVFDVLTYAVRQFKLQMEHEGGTDGMAYVSGINYLYEYTYGELSGWMYAVNSETPSIGCGSYAVQDGDEILWQYTTNLGEDLK